MITRSEAIKNFLIDNTHKDLANLYDLNMECQVNVAQDNGERVEGEYKGRIWHSWTDGISTWKTFRIPNNAAIKPEYIDLEMKYDLSAHAEGIGMTGFDWKNKKSKWVGFDFDSIIGHKHNKGLTDEQIKELVEKVKEISWVTIRKSTGGKGIHLYIFINPEIQITVNNHNEHAALARSILSYLSGIIGYDFQSKIDTCGGNLWVWHRRMIKPDGLSLIKQGTTLNQIPSDWLNHLKVITGKKHKAIPLIVNEEGFDELVCQYNRVPLDQEHKRIMELIYQINQSSYWNSDLHIFITHTYTIDQIFQNKENKIKGIYKTIAKGTEQPDLNCWATPLKNGVWIIRRYTKDIVEESTWEIDKSGYARCFFNQEPSFETASKIVGGIENSKGGFVFKNIDEAIKVAKIIGINDLDNLPQSIKTREVVLKKHKDGKLIISVPYNDHDEPLPGWLKVRKTWELIVKLPNSDQNEIVDIPNMDSIVRHLITETGDDAGWVVRSDNLWKQEPLVHIRSVLEALGYTPKERNTIIGTAVLKPYTLINKPFKEEFMGDRQWNRGAAQLKFTILENKENLRYPTWNKILNHLGKNLDLAVQENKWCQISGLKTGADYLKIWISSLFQEPEQPLSYLFFWGNQNCGKSSFHEMLNLLMTNGVTRCDNALVNTSNFNGELLNAVLAVIEEVDLKKNAQAYAKIKDWVSAVNLPIHIKNRTPFTIKNICHFIQCSNSVYSCPIFSGDSRITVIKVDDLDPKNLVPKRELTEQLTKEGQDFLTEILSIELPYSQDRLNVPAIITDDKSLLEKDSKSLLEVFIDDFCLFQEGELIKFTEFYEKFIRWIDPNVEFTVRGDPIGSSDVAYWTKIRVGKEIPLKFCKGRLPPTAQFFIGNILWRENQVIINGEKKKKWRLVNDRLVPIN